MLPVPHLEVTKYLKTVRRLSLWEIHVHSKRIFHNPKVLIRLCRTPIINCDRFALGASPLETKSALDIPRQVWRGIQG